MEIIYYFISDAATNIMKAEIIAKRDNKIGSDNFADQQKS